MNKDTTIIIAECLGYRPEWIKSLEVIEVDNPILYPYEVRIRMINDFDLKYYLSERRSTSLLSRGGYYVGTLSRPVV